MRKCPYRVSPPPPPLRAVTAAIVSPVTVFPSQSRARARALGTELRRRYFEMDRIVDFGIECIAEEFVLPGLFIPFARSAAIRRGARLISSRQYERARARRSSPLPAIEKLNLVV